MQEAAIQAQLDVQPPKSHAALALDLIERATVIGLTLLFLIRFLPYEQDGPYALLLMISESLGALCMVIRRPGLMATSLYAWLVAVIGTWTPLFVAPGGDQFLPMSVAVGMMTAGLMCSISGKIFLRRSFGIVAANRGIQKQGPYRIVRHPIYFGYLLTQVGFLSISFSGWNLLVYLGAWLAMVLRIAAEENVLSRDKSYRAYRLDVPSRLIPALW